MKVWNEEEGVLDTQVLATHEERFGQPAGTESPTYLLHSDNQVSSGFIETMSK